MIKSEFLTFTAGNLISIVVFIIGAATVWQKMKDAIEALGNRIGNQEDEMREITKMGVLNAIQQHERRISALEIAASQIAEIRTDLLWIKRSLGRLENDGENHSGSGT